MRGCPRRSVPEASFGLSVGGELRGAVITSRDDRGPYIDSIQVDPRWQGRGMGRALLVRALGALQDAGNRDDVGLVYLRQNVPAEALYRSVGFVPSTFSRNVGRGYWIRRRTLRAVLDRAATAKYR